MMEPDLPYRIYIKQQLDRVRPSYVMASYVGSLANANLSIQSVSHGSYWGFVRSGRIKILSNGFWEAAVLPSHWRVLCAEPSRKV